MQKHEIRKKLDKIKDLPTLPDVALRVNEMLQDYEISSSELAATIEKDLAMVPKILRLVNSAFFGFTSKISSLRHAITILGYSTVRNAVTTVAIIDALNVQNGVKEFNISQFWVHSISVAVVSRYLSQMIHAETPEDAFTAGLLHDIGKVVLVRYFPDLFLRIHLHCENEGVTFDEAESQENGYSHGSIGAYLIRKWKLPQNLEDSVRYHHSGHPKVNDSDQFQAVVLADTIVNMMNGHKNIRIDFQSIPTTIQEVMRQPLLEIRHWYPEVKKEIAQACELLLKEQ